MTITDIAEQAARAAHAPQQPAQPQQPVMMMPPTSISVGETPDKQNVIVQINTIYGQTAIALTPNQALDHSRLVRAKAKELNGHVVKRQGPGGAVLLDRVPVVIEDGDEGDDEATGDGN